MEFTIGNSYHGFELIDQWKIEEVESEAFYFVHKKSGAKLLYLKNDDDNKVFSVSFRTPPVNSCGTPHIMEHSVLCGSKKYPLKEPFVELVKSSLNTFLNAMTFPDKTMYPVASKNDADFRNLTDVYCDAVFNPMIRQNPYTFLQEGWHYHIEKEEDPLVINGVVYNEMKGAFSDPEEIMMRHVQLSLYPQTAYAFESGGDPDVIPELTYRKFMDYYDAFYHASNAYLYLYGDMDVLQYLELLDREYLSSYDAKAVDSLPHRQDPFPEPRHLEIVYSIDEEDSDERKAYFTANYKIGEATDSLLSYSFNVLMNILFDSDASPLKHALIEADIADEISYDYVTGVREPYFSIIAKNADPDQYEQFVNTIDATLKSLIKNGIDSDIIKAALNGYEFELREADSGTYPRGLIYNIDIMESWLYDAKPGVHLQYEPYLNYLRENETSEYYTALIRTYILENKHSSTICLLPERGLEAKKNAETERRLAELKANLSRDELQKLIDQTQELMKRQNTPDSEEAKNTVPVLSLDEIPKKLNRPNLDREDCGNAIIYTHTDKTRGIVYVDLNFKMILSDPEQISLAELLTKVIGVYATECYGELALSNMIGTYLGDTDVNLYTHQSVTDLTLFEKRFVFFAKSLAENLPKLYEIANEVLLRTRLDLPQRLYKTVCEEISKFESKLINAAHTVAIGRLNAMATPRGAYNEYWNGIRYYQFLTKIKKQLESDDASVLSDMSRLMKQLINRNGLDVLLTCDAKHQAEAVAQTKRFLATLPEFPLVREEMDWRAEGGSREGIVIPSKVMYVGLGGNFRMLGEEYAPDLLVLKKYLTSVFLWDNIRILGGAYGALMSVDKTGNFLFVSYRDPKLKETIDVYRNVPETVQSLSVSEKDISKLIIGTISDVDAPQPVYTIGRKMLHDLYKNDDWELQQQNRAKILSVTAESLRALYPLAQKVIDQNNICAIGSEEQLRRNETIFDKIYSVTRLES